MYQTKIEITGEELKYFVDWLVKNIEHEWHISVWYISLRPRRTAPHRISSFDWRTTYQKLIGLPYDEIYHINIMLDGELDLMAIKLRW